jgi:hypothetical protein
MTVKQSVQNDAKTIAGDVVTWGGTLTVILTVLLNAAPSIHLPAQYIAVLLSASTVVATVVAQARRIARAKTIAKRTAPLTK